MFFNSSQLLVCDPRFQKNFNSTRCLVSNKFVGNLSPRRITEDLIIYSSVRRTSILSLIADAMANVLLHRTSSLAHTKNSPGAETRRMVNTYFNHSVYQLRRLVGDDPDSSISPLNPEIGMPRIQWALRGSHVCIDQNCVSGRGQVRHISLKFGIEDDKQ